MTPKLRIVEEEGAFLTRIYLWIPAKPGSQPAKPIWNEERRTFDFEQGEPSLGCGSGPSEIQIAEFQNRDEGKGLFIQDLIDDLWRRGYRPSDAIDRTDTLKAKDSHIKDLNESRSAIEGLMEKVIDRIPKD